MGAGTRRTCPGAGIGGLFGRLDRQRDFLTVEGIEEAEIDSRRPLLMVAMDGEARPMETPLRYRIRKGALKLIVP